MASDASASREPSAFHASWGGPWHGLASRLPTSILGRLSPRLKAPVKLMFLIPRLHAQLATDHQGLVWDYDVELIPRWTVTTPNPYLQELIALGQNRYRAILSSWTRFRAQIESIPPAEWSQNYMPPLDAISLYCQLCQHRPRRYVEVGSGASTRFARRAIDDWGLGTRIVSIDPQPRAPIDHLCDQMLRCRLEQIDLALFDELDAGDVVVLDGTHRCLMNSDVTTFFLDILPRLPSGVLVGIHDVFLPYDYPQDVARLFFASEQYILAALLLGDRGHRYPVEFPCAYVSQTMGAQSLDNLWSGYDSWSRSFPTAPAAGHMFWVMVR